MTTHSEQDEVSVVNCDHSSLSMSDHTFKAVQSHLAKLSAIPPESIRGLVIGVVMEEGEEFHLQEMVAGPQEGIITIIKELLLDFLKDMEGVRRAEAEAALSPRQ